MKEKKLQFSLKAGKSYSGLNYKDICKRIKHSPSWLSMVECGKRRLYADELIALFTIYGLDHLQLNQIFLPTNLSKSEKRINQRASAKHNSKRVRRSS